MSATATVHRAARGDAMTVVARWGLAARATIYLLIGLLAIAIARGSSRQEADQRGALQELTRHTGGTVLVAIIGIGLAGYALWRLSEAAFGVVGDGKKAGPRFRSFARAVIYGFFAVSALEVVRHAGTSQAGQQEFWSAKAMRHSGGRWAVGIIGAIVVVCALILIWEGVRRKFTKYLALGRMTPATRKTVTVLGVVGTVARGVVFALAGIFIVSAAVDYNPRKAGGLDRALRELAGTSPWLLVAVAVGLVIFGVYGYAEAIWRRT
jgi:hypothetical protein